MAHEDLRGTVSRGRMGGPAAETLLRLYKVSARERVAKQP